MAALVGIAHARNLSTSSETLRATWAGFSLKEPIFGITASFACSLNLEGSLHGRTIAKSNYNLIGYITRAAFSPPTQCAGGEASVLAETLPWHIRYQSFAGTLPDIRSIAVLVSRASFRLRINGLPGVSCLFTTRETLAEHGLITFNRNTTTRELTSAEIRSEITSNEGCEPSGFRVRFILTAGPTANLTVLNSSGKITVTLI
jgi:hypothetical protein